MKVEIKCHRKSKVPKCVIKAYLYGRHPPLDFNSASITMRCLSKWKAAIHRKHYINKHFQYFDV